MKSILGRHLNVLTPNGIRLEHSILDISMAYWLHLNHGDRIVSEAGTLPFSL